MRTSWRGCLLLKENMFGLSALDVAKAAMQFTQYLDDADLGGLKCDAGGINGHCR